MRINLQESSWQRACKDTETFRSKIRWFLGVEMVGSGLLSSITAGILWDRSMLSGWQVGLITFGIFVAGLFLIYGIIFLWNLFRAPYRQRNEARKELVESDDKFGKLGYIEGFMYKAINLRKTLIYINSRGISIDDYDLNDFRRWNKTVSDYLQENMPSELPNWFKSVDIGLPVKQELETVVKAYDSGFEILRCIQMALVNQTLIR